MDHAVILAPDSGEALRPLTSADTPTAFLALGDRRTFLQRSVERLGGVVGAGNIWVLVRSEDRARADAELGNAFHIITVAPDSGVVGALRFVLSQIGSGNSADVSILLKPATLVVSDEDGFRDCVRVGLAESKSEGIGLAFAARGRGAAETVTGVQVWPGESLVARLGSIGVDEYESSRDVLASIGEGLAVLSVGDVEWLDVTDWGAVGRLLEYVEKPWGYERLWALNQHYAAKVLFIRAGESLSLQYHETKDETIRIASGRIRFRFGTSVDELETTILEPGMSFAIPPRLVHQMEALEDCTVIEVSTSQLADVVRLEDRYGRA